MAAKLLQQGDALQGRWVIRAIIGAGNFGAVYSALDRESSLNVAVKTLLPNALEDPEMIKRFLREGEICEKLRHENTTQLRHVGQYYPDPNKRKTAPFMVFDLVQGLPIGQLMKLRGPLSVDETCAVLIQLMESLTEAHSLGILHRDLKPDNLMVEAPRDLLKEPDWKSDQLCPVLGIPEPNHPCWKDFTKLQVKVLDFGLGKVLEIGDRRVKALTAAGVAAGTSHYMSPEQVKAQTDVDYRADIYGAAMLLHMLLTGKPAYDAKNALKVAFMHVEEDIPDLPAPYTGHPIAQVFKKAAAKNREDRYQSAAEMEWALQCVLAPELLDQEPPDFESPPEIIAKRKGLFARLFGR